MATPKITVVLPDGTTGVRRSPHPYSHVVAALQVKTSDAPRRVEYTAETCPNRKYHRRPAAASLRAFVEGQGGEWTPALSEYGCNHVFSERPLIALDPPRWVVCSWHHSVALASKAIGSHLARSRDGMYARFQIVAVPPVAQEVAR